MDAHYYAIGTDGRQYGPLSDAEIRLWLADGRVSRHSRARRASESQWMALREMPEFEEATRPPYVGGGLPEGEPSAAPPSLEPRTAIPSGRPGEIDPVACLRRALALVASDFWTLGLPAVATLLVIFSFSILGTAGVVLSVLLNDILLCGLFVLYIGAIRGRRPSLQEIVDRLGPLALRIILAGIVQSLISAPFFVSVRQAILLKSTTAAAVAAVLTVPTLYLLVAYAFLLPLMVDRNLGIRAALTASRHAVHPQWLRMFGLLAATILLLVVSVLLAGFPLLVTIPVSMAAFCLAYTDLFDAER